MSTSTENRFCFRSYGVTVALTAESPELLELAARSAERALVGNLEEISSSASTEHSMHLYRRPDGVYVLNQNGKDEPHREVLKYFLKFFDSMVRLTIAEHAVNRLFIHAGAIGWRGKAIVYPADSFGGKSTLTAEFVKLGAEYFSDDYAVFDEDGLLYPFPRPISMRHRDSQNEPYTDWEIPIADLGGTIASKPIPVGCILFTHFDEKASWDPEFLTPGQSALEMISQTIPIRYDPDFSLKVLKKITSNAILVKCPRHEAADFAKLFLEFIDKRDC